jgi:hypothetical protein
MEAATPLVGVTFSTVEVHGPCPLAVEKFFVFGNILEKLVQLGTGDFVRLGCFGF